MTGYAKRQFVVGNKTLSVEIKTLNSKQLDLNVKLPALLRDKELDIRSLLGRLERGKVDVVFSVESADNVSTTLNQQIAIDRFREAERLSLSLGCEVDKVSLFNLIVAQPSVWENAVSVQLSDDESAQLMEGLSKAVDEVETFRQEEGEVLRRDFDKHVDAIEKRLESIPQYEGERIQTAKDRICRYFSEFALNEMNKERFEQELIYYLEKLDITEEKVRLRKHIDFFRKTMDEEPICGKKLGFIAQEMGREINTTGSKANHLEIQKLVVEMKDELEKIKEQLGNIL